MDYKTAADYLEGRFVQLSTKELLGGDTLISLRRENDMDDMMAEKVLEMYGLEPDNVFCKLQRRIDSEYFTGLNNRKCSIKRYKKLAMAAGYSRNEINADLQQEKKLMQECHKNHYSMFWLTPMLNGFMKDWQNDD